MHWYISRLVFQITCGNGNHTPQFEEQFRLVQAADTQQAIGKAIAIGKQAQDTLLPDVINLVRWEFVNVSELFQLTEWIDGATLYSHVNEVTDAASYIDMVNENAAYLHKQRLSQQYLNLI